MTLGEIKVNDIANLEWLLSHGKEMQFLDMREYMTYQQGFIAMALERVGNKALAAQYLNRKTADDVYALDAALKEQNICLEGRIREGEDEWRSGHYVYKNGEIVAFIQLPKEVSRFIYTTTPNAVKAIVCTF
jgi:rhodanese-related sulfurtransferase